MESRTNFVILISYHNMDTVRASDVTLTVETPRICLTFCIVLNCRL